MVVAEVSGGGCDNRWWKSYFNDIVKGCLSSIDTTKKSVGNGGKKKGEAQFRIINLGNTCPISVHQLVSILATLRHLQDWLFVGFMEIFYGLHKDIWFLRLFWCIFLGLWIEVGKWGGGRWRRSRGVSGGASYSSGGSELVVLVVNEVSVQI